MSPTLSTFVLETINFLLLAGVLSWFLFKPVRKAINDLRDAEAKRDAEAQSRLKEAEAQRTAMIEDRRKLELELDSMRADALAAAEKEANAVRAQAAQAAASERENARRQAFRVEQAQIESTADAAAAAAGDLVRKLLIDIDGPELERALVSAACKELESLNGRDLRPVTVESANSISSEERLAIGKATGAGDAVTFVLRPDLGVGLRIRTASGEVDASARGLSLYAQRELQRHFAEAAKGQE